MDSAELKALWVRTVRRLLNSDTYRVSNSFDNIFESVSAMLTARPQINPERFVEIQIKHMLSKGLVEKLFPNVLSGDHALARYVSAPSPQHEEMEILESLQSQAKCFSAVCATMGEDFAFANKVVDYNPLFLAFMMWSAKREIPPQLRANANAELRIKPLASRFFPEDYLRSLL